MTPLSESSGPCAAAGSGPSAPDQAAASHTAAAWADRVGLAARAREHPKLILTGLGGYIAWAWDEADPARRDLDLCQTLNRWRGAPAATAAKAAAAVAKGPYIKAESRKATSPAYQTVEVDSDSL